MMVRLATDADAVRCGTTMTMAFLADPVMRWFFPDDDYIETATPLNVFMMRRFAALEALWCTDDAVALAGWLPPGRPDPGLEWPEVDHPQWRLDRFEAIGRVMAEHTPADEHWYLNVLATHPDWQRQGLGGELMAEVFSIADREGFPCYLETQTPELVAYYRHHGFEVRSEWDLPLDGPHMWGMFRERDRRRA